MITYCFRRELELERPNEVVTQQPMTTKQRNSVPAEADADADVLWDKTNGQIDRAALTAFVHSVEADAFEDTASEGVTAAKQLVQLALDSTESTSDDSNTVAVETVESLATAERAYRQPINHDQLPTSVAVGDAETAYDAVLEYLVAEGPATKSALLEDIYPTHSLGVTSEIWFEQVMMPALEADETVSYRDGSGYLLGGW